MWTGWSRAGSSSSEKPNLVSTHFLRLNTFSIPPSSYSSCYSSSSCSSSYSCSSYSSFTILYSGPGEWSGVFLDEPIGKNDGSVRSFSSSLSSSLTQELSREGLHQHYRPHRHCHCHKGGGVAPTGTFKVPALPNRLDPTFGGKLSHLRDICTPCQIHQKIMAWAPILLWICLTQQFWQIYLWRRKTFWYTAIWANWYNSLTTWPRILAIPALKTPVFAPPRLLSSFCCFQYSYSKMCFAK